MGLEKGAVKKEKLTEAEEKKRRQEEVKHIIGQIRALLRQEQGTAADSSEWKEFETALAGFLNGDIKGNAVTLSIKLLDNIQSFSKGKKNFIEYAKGQQIAQKLHQEMSKVPGALEDPHAAPMIIFLGHLAAADEKTMKKRMKRDEQANREAAEKDGWVFVDHTGRSRKSSAPKAITVEEGEKEQTEAMEALKEFHKSLGVKSPEEIKKEQNQLKGMV